jgi:hypothetical protein
MVNRYCRKFHDPWGNKQGNRRSQVCRWQYMVGKAQLHKTTWSDNDEVFVNVNDKRSRLDLIAAREHTASRYLLSTKRGVERMRR